MTVSTQIVFSHRTKEVRDLSLTAFYEYVEKTTDDVVAEAYHNVSPGVGPGPHPHISSHEDTGLLADSIEHTTTRQGFLIEGEVWSGLDYGFFLEYGWITPDGRFFRYPWLSPALMHSLRDAEGLVKDSFRRYVR